MGTSNQKLEGEFAWPVRAKHPDSQKMILTPNWMFRGALTLPFHIPKVGLATFVSKAPALNFPGFAKTCQFQTLKNSLRISTGQTVLASPFSLESDPQGFLQHHSRGNPRRYVMTP